MPITMGFFSWERINHFPFISYGKNSFGIHPVWHKSKDLERIKDVYRGTTVFTSTADYVRNLNGHNLDISVKNLTVFL
jgi:hypothetical protein